MWLGNQVQAVLLAWEPFQGIPHLTAQPLPLSPGGSTDRPHTYPHTSPGAQ